MPEIKLINTVAALFFLSITGVFGQYSPACADYYKYTDNKGTVCITNNLKTIPRKYRSTMKVVREDEPARANGGSQPQAPSGGALAVQRPFSSDYGTMATPTARTGSRFVQYETQHPWIKPLLAIGSVAVAFLFLIKLTTLFSSPRNAILTSLALLLGFFAITCGLYSDHLTSSYVTLKTKISGIFVKANGRAGPQSAVKEQKPSENPMK